MLNKKLKNMEEHGTGLSRNRVEAIKRLCSVGFCGTKGNYKKIYTKYF